MEAALEEALEEWPPLEPPWPQLTCFLARLPGPVYSSVKRRMECPGGVTSMLRMLRESWLERHDYGIQRGKVVLRGGLDRALTPQIGHLVGCELERWGGGLQCWMDLRETQVYQFMSNIIN